MTTPSITPSFVTLRQKESNSWTKPFYAGISFNILSILALSIENQRSQLCLPSVIHKYAERFWALNTSINQYFGRMALVSTVPLFEEFVFRYVIQDFLLKQLPSRILQRTAPSYQPLVHTKTAATIRIIAAAILFSLGHARAPVMPYNSSSFLIHKFVLGVFCGIFQEATQDFRMPVAFHIGNNWIPFVLGWFRP